jgi:hypothetical protein
MAPADQQSPWVISPALLCRPILQVTTGIGSTIGVMFALT